MSVDGSIKNMRKISETGKLNDTMIKQLEISNNFFKCLIEDLKGVSVPEAFASYNDDIINYLNKAKTSLEAMKNSHDEEIIKSNAKIFIESNREAVSYTHLLILLNQYFLYSLEKFDMDFLAILTASSRLGFRRGSSASENLAKFHKAILG